MSIHAITGYLLDEDEDYCVGTAPFPSLQMLRVYQVGPVRILGVRNFTVIDHHGPIIAVHLFEDYFREMIENIGSAKDAEFIRNNFDDNALVVLIDSTGP